MLPIDFERIRISLTNTDKLLTRQWYIPCGRTSTVIFKAFYWAKKTSGTDDFIGCSKIQFSLQKHWKVHPNLSGFLFCSPNPTRYFFCSLTPWLSPLLLLSFSQLLFLSPTNLVTPFRKTSRNANWLAGKVQNNAEKSKTCYSDSSSRIWAARNCKQVSTFCIYQTREQERFCICL